MKIHGLQKMTLLDYPGKVACTVFLAGCQLRCPFCHNSELFEADAAEPVMDDGELLAFLSKRVGLLEGVCFTGGEPLLTPGLPELLRKVKALGYPVKLDTNGFLPDRLKALAEEGLIDYVAMDVKSSPANYASVAGVPGLNLAAFEKSLQFLLSGPVDYELRTTVVAELHSLEDFDAIGPWIKGARRYFLQSFADRDTVLFSGFSAPSGEFMTAAAERVRPFVREVSVRGE